MDKGKRRSTAQRIGQKGESLFTAWAVDHHLSPNKTGQDLGVDFFCQVLHPSSGKSEEVTGTVLAVHVRATSGKSRPRILVNRTDAVDMLRHTHPACLIGLHNDKGQVGFLFLDVEFIDRLREFLNSSRQSLSIRLDEMEVDPAVFDRKLMSLIRPGVQQRLAIYKTQRAIESAAPGASVSLHHSIDGGAAVVQLPWLSSALLIDKEQKDETRLLAFEKGTSPDEWPGAKLRPEFLPLLDLADGPTILSGAIEGEKQIMVESNGKTASTIFRIRRIEDEFAYVHDLGLAIVQSDRRRRKKTWVHAMNAWPFKGSTSLGAGADALPFFRLLQPGARILLNGTPVAIETWGQALPRLGHSTLAIEQVVTALGLQLNSFYLGDLRDEEFALSLAFLEASLIRRIPAARLIPAFLLDVDEEYNVDSIPTETKILNLPVVLNFKEAGVVVWFRARSTVFLLDGQWCGIRVEEQFASWHTIQARTEKSVHPELWVKRSWAPIPIGLLETRGRSFKQRAPSTFTVEASVVLEDGSPDDSRGEAETGA